MNIIRTVSWVAIAIATAVAATPSAWAADKDSEATVSISVKNFGGKNISVKHSTRGVYSPQEHPVTFGHDSTATVTIPTDGIEYMILQVQDPLDKQKSFSKSLYLMPGETRVGIDGTSKDSVQISPSTGNPADGEIASELFDMEHRYFELLMGARYADQLGLNADSVASVVTGKLDNYIDSVCNVYSTASPEILSAFRNSMRLYELEMFLILYDRKKDDPVWQSELKRLRAEINTGAPEHAIFYHFPRIMTHLYGIDRANEVWWGITNSELIPFTDNAAATLSPEGAETVIGTTLFDNASKGIYSQSVPEITDRFKALYPQSAFIPVLEESAARNIAFNNPEENDNIHFLDNSAIRTVTDILSPYKGKPLFIDIWATWCRSCIESFAHVEPLQKYAAENGIQLLYLSIDEGEGIENQWKNMALTHNLIGDHIMINPYVKMGVYDTFGENGFMFIPQYAVVDREGNLRILPGTLAESNDFEPLRAELEKIK